MRQFTTVNGNRGREEIRRYFIAEVPADLPGRVDGSNLRSIGMVL